MSNTVRGLLDVVDTTAVGEQSKTWSTKTADEIIADLLAMLDAANRDPTAFFRRPRRARVPNPVAVALDALTPTTSARRAPFAQAPTGLVMALKDHVQVTITVNPIGVSPASHKTAETYLNLGIISKEEYAAWLLAEPAIDLARFPHVCPSCGAASYNGVGVEHADETAAAKACALRRVAP